MKLNLKQRGFTLVEFLLYMGIFSILLVVTLQMFGSVFDAELESQATSNVAADGRFILSRFAYDLERAQSITTPSSQGSASATFAIVVTNKTLTYSLSNSNLLLVDSGSSTSDQLNGEGTTVSNLSFIRLAGGAGKDLIQISFTLNSIAIRKTKSEIVNFQTTAGLR